MVTVTLLKQRNLSVNGQHMRRWTYILWLCLTSGLFLSKKLCTASRTHVIYWDPDNIIFQTKPAPLLYVQPRDEVIFVCPYESLYILWTYEKKALDTCSLWLNNTMMVDLLFKCTRKPLQRAKHRSDAVEQTEAYPTTFRVCNHSCDHNPPKIPSTSSLEKSALRMDPSRLHMRSNISEYHTKDLNRTRRNFDYAHAAKFTLLIDDLSWANGNPRFVYNRPVFFIAQSAVCLSKNMRIVIVYGQYCFDAPPEIQDSSIDGRMPNTYCPNSQGSKPIRMTQGNELGGINHRRAISSATLPEQSPCSGSFCRIQSFNFWLNCLCILFVLLFSRMVFEL